MLFVGQECSFFQVFVDCRIFYDPIEKPQLHLFMKTRFILPLFLFSFLLFSCKGSKNLQSTSTKVKSGKIVKPTMQNANAFKLFGISDDESYGYSENNPIKVGGAKKSEGPKNEQRYLNALAGPNGEEITYNRKGSCCAFETENGFMGGGLLDRYEVKWKGAKKPVIIYINMYDMDDKELKAPKGLTLKEG